jgi:2'-5' RNA ligase
MNQRFFIALLPPDSIQDEVRQIQSDFEARYSTKATLKAPPHITLIPPFELSDRIELLQIELEKFAKMRSPFTINLSGFAAFPPRVIFLDVVPNPVLPNLYLDIAATLANTLGIIDPYASRPFVPHMTVGFRDLTPENFELAWAEFRDRKINFAFEAINLTLLAHDEQKWNVLSSFALKSTAEST